jgi:hypothetical protein
MTRAAIAAFFLWQAGSWDRAAYPVFAPLLEQAPKIDGDLSEWKYRAFTDGVWDILRLRQTPWYEPARNRLTDHSEVASPEDDLNARYYIAWDRDYLYLGAEAHDNVNDVTDPAHEPKRWYYKDAICWFIEAPRRAAKQSFGRRDNAFCFVIDAQRPSYAAWWRHGSPDRTYIEEPIPKGAVDYALRMNPWGRGAADFILEARVKMAPTLGASAPEWTPPKIGDQYGIEIVHTDPDGGDYGGHFILYGTGDDDSTWGVMQFQGPVAPVERKPD